MYLCRGAIHVELFSRCRSLTRQDADAACNRISAACDFVPSRDMTATEALAEVAVAIAAELRRAEARSLAEEKPPPRW